MQCCLLLYILLESDLAFKIFLLFDVLVVNYAKITEASAMQL